MRTVPSIAARGWAGSYATIIEPRDGSIEFPDSARAAEAVLAVALRLDLDARAEIAAELLASLDGPADPDREAAWNLEIERRVAAIEAGTATLEAWDDVKRWIEKEILGR